MMVVVMTGLTIMALAAGAAADDIAALLAFKASGADPDGYLSSWDAGTSPCGEGWARDHSGWGGVKCDASGGRVTSLKQQRWSSELTGSVAELASLTQLTYLSLCDTGVTGPVAELAEQWETKLMKQMATAPEADAEPPRCLWPPATVHASVRAPLQPHPPQQQAALAK